ncbi:MAG: hypothetical protein ACTJLK_01950 [Anaplasma sp.]
MSCRVDSKGRPSNPKEERKIPKVPRRIGIRPKSIISRAIGGGPEKFSTAGFRAFCTYVRVTMFVAAFATIPVVLLYVLSRPVGGAQCKWSAVKQGARVQLGLLHRLLSPVLRQFYNYLHVLMFNMLTFTLLTYALSGPITGTFFTFSRSLAWALVPTMILLCFAVAYHYASWIMQFSEPLPWRRGFSLLWRSAPGAHDRVDDSAFNLMFRDQIRDSMSMSSLARSDRQLLFGVPTAIVALICYAYDRCRGYEEFALNVRDKASSSLGGLSVHKATTLGLFRD